MEGKIIGIGGIFFRCEAESKTKEWYAEICGIKTDQWGASFVQKKVSQDAHSFTQWSPFPKDTSYFFGEEQQFMINYRVQNLDALVQKLKDNGCEILDEISAYDYGKFVHIRDIDGRAVELWEPIDEGLIDFTKAENVYNFE